MTISTGANVPVVTTSEIEAAQRRYIAKIGRPSLYGADVAAEIATRLAAGETLLAICRDSHMPHRATVNEWMREIPEFNAIIAQARIAWTYAMADEAKELIDATDGKAKDNQVRKAEAQARIRMELAAKYNFATFGDKKQSVNLNLNADASPVDLAAYLNR